jgi:hypothetical protein
METEDRVSASCNGARSRRGSSGRCSAPSPPRSGHGEDPRAGPRRDLGPRPPGGCRPGAPVRRGDARGLRPQPRLWREGGALEIEMLEQSAERLSFNVTRCRYAEMYRALGLADLGSSLSCQRDFSLVEGFNPAIGLDAHPDAHGRRLALRLPVRRARPDASDRDRPTRAAPRYGSSPSAPICRISSLHRPARGKGRTLSEDDRRANRVERGDAPSHLTRPAQRKGHSHCRPARLAPSASHIPATLAMLGLAWPPRRPHDLSTPPFMFRSGVWEPVSSGHPSNAGPS